MDAISKRLIFLPLKVSAALLSLSANADESIDLSDLGLDSFTPYLTERSRWWILIPLFGVVIVLFHLKKHTRKIRRNHD